MVLSDIQNAIDGIVQKFSNKPQQILSPLPKAQNQSFDIADNIVKNNPGASGLSYPTILQLAQQYGSKLLAQNPAQDIGNAASSLASTLTGGMEKAQAKEVDEAASVPSGVDAAMNYIQAQTPGGQDPMKYYKALGNSDFLDKIKGADKIRPGLSNLLLLQAFHESTLGNTSNNTFGILPGGEGSGKTASFDDPSKALDYQLSANVLGGGALGKGSEMDLLSNQGKPLTLGDINKFYSHYNPEGAYIDTIDTILGTKSKN